MSIPPIVDAPAPPSDFTSKVFISPGVPQSNHQGVTTKKKNVVGKILEHPCPHFLGPADPEVRVPQNRIVLYGRIAEQE